MKRVFIFLLVGLIMACGGSKPQEPKMDFELQYQYDEVLNLLQEVREKMNKPNLAEDYETVAELIEVPEALQFEFNPVAMDSLTLSVCQDMHERVENTREELVAKLAELQQTMIVKMHSHNDVLIESEMLLPVYLEKGDVLQVNFITDNPVDVKIFNADSKALLKTIIRKSNIEDSLRIQYRATYLVQVKPRNGATYVNGFVGYKAGNIDRIANLRKVEMEDIEAKRGDFLAKEIKGIKMQNIFEEPRKFTLRGQLKAAFSGSSRALVAIQVPAGATDILYSLRISTNETTTDKDGDFYKDMDHSYHRVKMLGLPIYESNRRSGLIATLLGENVPVREEDAYINMYVFYNTSQAKKFQDGALASDLQYNVDYSTLGTQSCNGRIQSKGNRTIYLAFENERMRYNNYVWLEAVSAVPNTEYVKPHFKLEEE